MHDLYHIYTGLSIYSMQNNITKNIKYTQYIPLNKKTCRSVGHERLSFWWSQSRALPMNKTNVSFR